MTSQEAKWNIYYVHTLFGGDWDNNLLSSIVGNLLLIHQLVFRIYQVTQPLNKNSCVKLSLWLLYNIISRNSPYTEGLRGSFLQHLMVNILGLLQDSSNTFYPLQICSNLIYIYIYIYIYI